LLDDRLRFETAIFYMEQTNRCQFIPNPDAATDPTAPANRITFGSLYSSRGFEASLQWRPWEGGSLTAQCSRLDPKWEDFVIQSAFAPPVDLSGKTRTGVAENIVYFAIEQRARSWLTGRASFEFYDDYQVTQDNSLETGAYQLVNLGATIAPRGWNNAALDLALTNALNEEYYFHSGGRSAATLVTPGAPR
jgi:hypothetical protein